MDTPIHEIHEMLNYAKRNDSWDEVYAILKQEMKRGNNIVNTIPEGRDYSALHHAACMDNLDAVKKLINEYGAKTSLRSRRTKLLPIEVAGTVEKWRRGGIMKVQPYLEELSRQEGSSGSGPTAPPAPAPSEPAAPEPAPAPEPQPQPEPEPEPAEPEPAPAESKTTKWKKKDYMPWSLAWKNPDELREKIGKNQEKLDELYRKGIMDPEISKLLTEKQDLIRILKMKDPSYTGGLQGGGLSKKKRKKKTKRTKRKNNKRTKRTKRNRRTKRT